MWLQRPGNPRTLPSVTLRTRKPCCVSQFQSQRPENQGAEGLCLSPKAWGSAGTGEQEIISLSLKALDPIASRSKGSRTDVSAKTKWANFPIFPLSVLFKPSMNWRMPTSIGNLYLVLPTQMLISFRDILTDTPRSNLLPFIWASLRPVKLTYKISHPNIWNADWYKFQNPHKHYITQLVSLLLVLALCFLSCAMLFAASLLSLPSILLPCSGTFAPPLPTMFFSWSLRSQFKY